jgi:hypothetical protein
VNSQNKTDFIIIKETNMMNEVTLWEVDRNLTKTKIKKVNNMDWLFVASNNQLWYSSEYYGYQELYTIDLMNNMLETKVVDDSKKLTFIYGWFIQGDKNYVIGEFDGVNQFARIENNELNNLLEITPIEHKIFYKKDGKSIVFSADETYQYDVLTLKYQAEVSERNQRGVMISGNSSTKVSVVMNNSKGQEEIITFYDYPLENNTYATLQSNSLSKSTKPTEGTYGDVENALSKVDVEITFLKKGIISHKFDNSGNYRLSNEIIYGEETINTVTGNGRFVVNYDVNSVASENDRRKLIGDMDYTNNYTKYTDYTGFSNVTAYKEDWSYIYSLESDNTVFYCKPNFNTGEEIKIRQALFKKIIDFKMLNNTLYLKQNNYIEKIDRETLFDKCITKNETYYK